MISEIVVKIGRREIMKREFEIYVEDTREEESSLTGKADLRLLPSSSSPRW